MESLFGKGWTGFAPVFLAEQAAPEGLAAYLPMLGTLVFFGLLMYFMVFLPQKKKDKKAKELMESLQTGMKVTTQSGVVGKIVNVKDDIVTIETGVERTQIDYLKAAILDAKME